MTPERLGSGAVGIAALILFASAAAADNQCVSCHRDAAFYSEYPKLYSYYQQWLRSPHERSGLTCDNCHGGDPDAESADAAHAGVLPVNDAESTLHFRKQPDTCGQCHSANRAEFIQSKHFAALMGQRAAPTCTTCHPAMSRRPELRTIVMNACRNCHGEGNSENLPTISGVAQHVFQQLNIAAGLLGWTRIHYESHAWPNDSRNHVRELEKQYEGIVSSVHQFELAQTDEATSELLDELREIFEAARLAHEQQPDP